MAKMAEKRKKEEFNVLKSWMLSLRRADSFSKVLQKEKEINIY
jgi:hypothetical protein